MMRIQVAVLLAIAALLAIETAWAFQYNLTYECEEDCLENTVATWNITLHKGAGEPIRVKEAEIMVSGTANRLALYNDSVRIVYTQEVMLAKGTLPEFSGATHLNASVCFTTLIDPRQAIADESFIGLERTYCERYNHTMPLYQCIDSSRCQASQACSNNTCRPLECGACEYVANHTCARHECCGNEECTYESTCQNNFCRPVECQQGYQPANHTCAEIICNGDERLEGSTCVSLGCLANETAANHTCTPLSCGRYETARNHTCAKIQLLAELKEVSKIISGGPIKKSQPTVAGVELTTRQATLMETGLLAAMLALVVLIGDKYYLNHHPKKEKIK